MEVDSFEMKLRPSVGASLNSGLQVLVISQNLAKIKHPSCFFLHNLQIWIAIHGPESLYGSAAAMKVQPVLLCQQETHSNRQVTIHSQDW